MVTSIPELQKQTEELAHTLPELIPSHITLVKEALPEPCAHFAFHLLLIAVPCSFDDPTATPEFIDLEQRLGLEILAHETYTAIGP